MSTRVMSACWPLRLPPPAKAVLISLADNANDHGECWPSIAHICERTCLGRTAVINAIKLLEAEGLLLADRSNGRHSRYAIDLQRVAQAELFAPEPVREANRSARRTGPPDARDQSARRTEPVREADSNHQEPSRTEKQKKRASAPPVSKPDGVSDRVWGDWLALRKAKRAPVTGTVVAEATREAAKAGMTLERFLTVWCARGSQGLQADWLKPNERAGPAPSPGKQVQGLMALEGLKRGNRLDSGRDRDGAAEALPALAGSCARG